MYRMMAAAVNKKHVQFIGGFGREGDPFTTILASKTLLLPFGMRKIRQGGFIRFLTERETERLMGLPDGWAEYGAAGERISPAQTYMSLGNSIAPPCASFIIEGIRNSVS